MEFLKKSMDGSLEEFLIILFENFLEESMEESLEKFLEEYLEEFREIFL